MDPTQLGAYQVESLIQQSDQRTHLIWKTILRGLATICAVVGIILQARVVKASGGYNYEYDYYYSSYDYWFSPESFAFLGLSLLWNCAEFITLCINKHGIHPGAHVGLDLIIWGGLLSAGIIQLIINYYSSLTIAAGVVKLCCCVLHFVLFVWACVDTHRRRRIRRAELVAQVTSAMQQQQLAQGRISTLGGLSTGAQNIPPGMALVPVEQLAQLRSLQATYQSDPVSPRPPIPQAYGQAQPYALVPHNEPVSPVAGTRGSVQHTINPLTGTPPVVAAPSSQSPTSENIAELRTAPGNY